MKSGSGVQGRAPVADGEPAPPVTTPVMGGQNGDSVSATDLLVDLGLCQRGIRDLLHGASATLGPISNQTLPAVVFTLSGLIHATEMAVNKVLDHAEGLASDRDRLGRALARLEPLLNQANPAVKRAWLDVMECNQALAGRVMSIMSAMAFQDLTTQHLSRAIKSVEQVREQLLQVLVLLDLPLEAEGGSLRRGTRAVPLEGSRQALADQLWAEMKER